MSEVDRLSNSGLYPALPIADKSSRKDGSAGNPPGDGKSADKRPPPAPAAESRDPPRPPKSLIDDYA
ncbi:MAG: hypothetical protein ABSG30_05645 [Steroidobacteraceae bacterium]|jgi:hypothetical protein